MLYFLFHPFLCIKLLITNIKLLLSYLVKSLIRLVTKIRKIFYNRTNLMYIIDVLTLQSEVFTIYVKLVVS